MKKLNFLAVLAVVLVTVWSCQKTDSTDTQFSDLSAAEAVAAVASVDEVEGIIDDNIFYADSYIDFSGITGKGGHYDRSGFFSDCTTIEALITPNSTSVTITFEEGCTDRHGNEVSGTLTLERAAEDGNYSSMVTFADFTINGYVVNGTKAYSKVVENSNGNPERTSIVDITIDTDAGTFTKTGTRTREVTAGSDTDTYKDDEVTFTGSSAYTSADGVVISTEITTPLVRPAECKYIAQGIIQYSNDGAISTLDYGDGTCDKLATLTAADGTITEIKLRRGRKDCKGSHD